MRTLRIVLSAAMAAGLVGTGIAVAQEDQKQESAGPSSLPSPYVEAPSAEGFVVMEEEEWTITMADEPQKKLEDALDNLEAGDGRGAAHDLDKVAACTKSGASQSDGYIKKLLLEDAPVNPPPVMPTIEELKELIGLVEVSIWPQVPSN
jgi:hypothetical protein